ncbi:MAG TPA: hypothetical protein VFT84_04540, partial [Gemmatimonadales bacterium]|nr:hypothetical protein [Gemmatimonadales bacterium]
MGVALLIWLAEVLGLLNLLYSGTLVAASIALAVALAAWRVPAGTAPRARPPASGGLPSLECAIALAVVAVVFADWGLTAGKALDRGIFNFDSLWYHMPFAAEMAHSHSVTGFHFTETVFTNWFYPQNSELLHAVGILLVERDTLSLFLNFGWLAVAFLAAWCIGRPYGRGHLTVVAAAILLEAHTLVVREPGAAKNDLMAAALVLASIAILVNAWREANPGGRGSLPIGWALAIAGLAIGMAVGTKLTVLTLAFALTVAAIVLAPAGRRRAAALWWFLPALAGGGFWYLRNLIATGTPLPQVAHIGPVSLPHPVQLQTGRPDFSIVHYATDTGVWSRYFGPGLDHAFGSLWPLVIGGAVAGGAIALAWGGERVLRWMGGVALFGIASYLAMPLSAAGAEGAPTAFEINVRYAIPALLAGIVLLPLSPRLECRRRQGAVLAALVVTLVVTNRADAVLRDPNRLFGALVAVLAVLIPAALYIAWRRGARPRAIAGGIAALALTAIAIGYPVQRGYLSDRFGPGSDIPEMGLNPAYHWARGITHSRIGLAGTTAGFLQYGFYGTDLSNRVRYVGARGPHGAFNAIPTCGRFRAAVNAAGLDYLVTAPFLNFIHPDDPIASPEARWLREDHAAAPIVRSGSVTV